MKQNLGLMTSSISQRSYIHPRPEQFTYWSTASHGHGGNAPLTHLTIINFNSYNYEELTDTDIIQHLDVQENKETNKYLSDKDMMQYMQIFEKSVMRGVIRLASEHYTLPASETICARLLESTFLQF